MWVNSSSFHYVINYTLVIMEGFRPTYSNPLKKSLGLWGWLKLFLLCASITPVINPSTFSSYAGIKLNQVTYMKHKQAYTHNI